LYNVRRQRLHTFNRTRLPPIHNARFCVLGIQRRLVRRLEWLTLCPYCGAFPQRSHLPGIAATPVSR